MRHLSTCFIVLLASGLPFTATQQIFTSNAQAYDETKLIASDGAVSDYFGYSVAIDGDTAVVGAYQAYNTNGTDSGTAYVYQRYGDNWYENELYALAASSGDEFGYAVAIDGDTLAIGAIRGNAVYVYVRIGAYWGLQQTLSVASGGLGSSIAIDGDTLVAGAFLDNNNRGAAYIYTRSGTTWTQRKKLIAPTESTNSNVYFGCSVDIEGDTVVVGAYRYTYSGMVYSGAAWVWTGSGSSWSPLPTDLANLAGAELTANDCFGFSVDLNNETLLVGAYNDDRGSAYVFVRNGSTWSKQGNKLKPLNAPSGEGLFFGSSVSLLGDRAFIGADYDHIDDGREGSVHEFIREAGVWTEQNQLIYASDRESLDWFGSSVAFTDQYLLVGAYEEDEKASDAGAAYIYGLRESFDLQAFAQSWLTDDQDFDIAPSGGDDIVNLRDFAAWTGPIKPLTANAGPDKTYYGYAGDNPVFIMLDGTRSTGNIVSWLWYWNWDEGGGSEEGWDEVCETDFYPGVYNLTLTVTDSFENTASDDIVITIIDYYDQ